LSLEEGGENIKMKKAKRTKKSYLVESLSSLLGSERVGAIAIHLSVRSLKLSAKLKERRVFKKIDFLFEKIMNN
jgi:hypothetical protein